MLIYQKLLIYKELGVIQVPDMLRLSMWKFYYKLMNNTLPAYFHIMKPELPKVRDIYVSGSQHFTPKKLLMNLLSNYSNTN